MIESTDGVIDSTDGVSSDSRDVVDPLYHVSHHVVSHVM